LLCAYTLELRDGSLLFSGLARQKTLGGGLFSPRSPAAAARAGPGRFSARKGETGSPSCFSSSTSTARLAMSSRPPACTGPASRRCRKIARILQSTQSLVSALTELTDLACQTRDFFLDISNCSSQRRNGCIAIQGTLKLRDGGSIFFSDRRGRC